MNYESLRAEKMQALKEKNSLKNRVLTNVLSELVYQKKEKGEQALDEKIIVSVFRKMVKQVEETISLSKGRPEIQEELNLELEVLKSYLPQSISSVDLLPKIKALAEKNGIEKNIKNKGKLMALAIASFSDMAEGKAINQAVDSYLKE